MTTVRLMTLDEIRKLAAEVSAQLLAVTTTTETASAGGGSRNRQLPESLRERFIDVRAAMFQRGIYDPVLARFDSATAPAATITEIAEQLKTLAESL
jgi:hypothetical protein